MTRGNLNLRTFYLLFYIQIGDSIDIFYGFLYLIADGEHTIEVRAEEFDGNAGLCA